MLIYGHDGRRLEEKHPLHVAAKGFFDRLSAAQTNGRSWRLYLVAVSSMAEEDSEERLADGPVSGLALVRLVLDQAGTPPRPLPMFEWPIHQPDLPRTIAPADVMAEAGFVHVPVRTSDGSLKFQRKPGLARAVTVTWNAVPSTGKEVPPQAFGAYRLHEADHDDLAIVDEGRTLTTMTSLQQILPVPPQQAASAQLSMHDAQNWEGQYPVAVRTFDRLEAANVDPADMPQLWPGAYSWADASLVWPEELTAEEKSTYHSWIDRGRDLVGRPLHDYLLAILGNLAQENDQRLQVEVQDGPPPLEVRPLEWIAANSAVQDPYGWSALTHLGLACVVSLRDLVTGLLLGPEQVLGRLAAAQKELEKKLPDNAFGKHLAFDLPIQHPQAYRSGPSQADPNEIGLAMVQIALRPIPAPAQSICYGVLRLGAKNDGKTGVVALAGALDVLFPESSRALLTVAASQSVEATFAEGDVVMLRGGLESVGTARDALKDQFSLLLDEHPTDPASKQSELCTLPVAWWQDSKFDFRLSPFGRFPDQEPVEEGSNRFWCYLARAFARADPEADDVDDALEKAREKLLEDFSGLERLYRVWAARFFATAPVGEMNTAVVQPKSVDPVVVAADGHGRLRATRLLDEQWATVRGYSVSCELRYDRLNGTGLYAIASEDETEGVVGHSIGQADIYLPRIRALDPPAILAVRSLRASGGRQFHEVTLNHSEALLAQRNRSVALRLEFGEIRRSHGRAYAFGDFVDNLDQGGLLAGMKLGLAKTQGHETDAGTPGLEAADDTFLDLVPEARHGATRYQWAAEPHYYRQWVEIEATAGQALSARMDPLDLPALEPDPTQPSTDIEPLRCDSLTWAEYWAPWPGALWPSNEGDTRTERQKVWTDALTATGETGTWIAQRLGPAGYRLAVRLPQHRESLALNLRDSAFAHESVAAGSSEAPAGHLPDAQARVLICDQDPSTGVTVPIACIVPRITRDSDPEVSWSRAFAFQQVSSEFEVDLFRIAPQENESWADGLWAMMNLRPVASLASATGKKLPELAAIENLVGMDENPELAGRHLLDRSQLHEKGPLARLAPLAIRLMLKRTPVEGPDDDASWEVGMASPLPAPPRWLLRPHLEPEPESANAAVADQADLAIALRLLLDVQRRRAAAYVLPELPNAGAQQLLTAIETATYVAVSWVLDTERSFDKEQTRLRLLRGMRLWLRYNNDWISLGDNGRYETSKPGRVIATFHRSPNGEELSPAEIDAETDRLDLPWDERISAEEIGNLSALCDSLARTVHWATPMRKPVVFVQHGNAPQVPWGQEDRS